MHGKANLYIERYLYKLVKQGALYCSKEVVGARAFVFPGCKSSVGRSNHCCSRPAGQQACFTSFLKRPGFFLEASLPKRERRSKASQLASFAGERERESGFDLVGRVTESKKSSSSFRI